MSDLSRFLSTQNREGWSAKLWDGLIEAIGSRLAPLEEQLNIQKEVADAIIARGLSVIEYEIAPLVGQAEQILAESIEQLDIKMEILDRKVSAGVFFSASSTSANLTLGATINIYVKVEDRQFFAVSPYVTLSRAATAVNWATAKVENYNKTTGLLTLKLEQVTGAGGPFNDWVITSMPAVAYLQQAIYDATVALRNQVAADRTVVDSDKKAAQTARGEAQSAASAAVTARNGSQQALADVRNIIAPPVATPTAPRLGQIWWDGSILRVYDGTSFVPTVTTSIGGRRFEQGTFGASPSGVITVSGGFSFAMVFLNGALLQEGPDYTASSPTITITNPQPGDRYYVDAYLEADATDYYTKEQVILLLAAQKDGGTY
ncbi:hypothetical protein F9K91_07660 [Brucella tritici]|uniref:Uncharacterized protein n=1 Tax=Brucella tritici TaxID=94626 RepID=A0A833CL85_9HYPH|nr:hypothetical protein [Brucella tritici]KAB2665997.1 hypothetical protein F9K91_07660 [Brucella tritici]